MNTLHLFAPTSDFSNLTNLISANEEIETTQFPSKIVDWAIKNDFIDAYITEKQPLNTANKNSSISNPTSCVNTAAAVLTLMLSEEKKVEIIDRLKQSTVQTLRIPLSSTDPNDFWLLKVHNLFDAYTTHNIQNVSEFRKLKAAEQQALIHQAIRPVYQDFFESVIQPLILPIANDDTLGRKEKIESYKQILSTTEFNFNASIIQTILDTLDENELQVSPQQSFLYAISLRIADPSKANETESIHTFVIEQCYDEKQNSPAYNFYQSWINKGTLTCSPKSKQELVALISKLGGQGKFTTQELFGYKSASIQPLTLYHDINTGIHTLQGLSIRFCPCPFNPQVVPHNFLRMIDASASMTHIFNQMISIN